MGIPEKDANDGRETWEESEAPAIETIKTKLDIQDDLSIERSHRVGKPCPLFRHIDGAKVPSKPRPIVVRFWLVSRSLSDKNHSRQLKVLWTTGGVSRQLEVLWTTSRAPD